uniref:Uncharacterized protein n=1 Tax=Rousettus aegyptiacus TaxID=9407 RepID=A0A7J8IN47_ROUAE|nr:hypothetical protein HJG63_010766 [Rousettus aegyptiacus]
MSANSLTFFPSKCRTYFHSYLLWARCSNPLLLNRYGRSECFLPCLPSLLLSLFLSLSLSLSLSKCVCVCARARTCMCVFTHPGDKQSPCLGISNQLCEGDCEQNYRASCQYPTPTCQPCECSILEV